MLRRATCACSGGSIVVAKAMRKVRCVMSAARLAQRAAAARRSNPPTCRHAHPHHHHPITTFDTTRASTITVRRSTAHPPACDSIPTSRPTALTPPNERTVTRRRHVRPTLRSASQPGRGWQSGSRHQQDSSGARCKHTPHNTHTRCSAGRVGRSAHRSRPQRSRDSHYPHHSTSRSGNTLHHGTPRASLPTSD